MSTTPPRSPAAAGAAERVEWLHREHNKTAAAKYEAIREFAREHLTEQASRGAEDLDGLKTSVIAQIGLMCHTSPYRARTLLDVTRTLHDGLDHVRALFVAGELTEQRVTVIVAATLHLSTAERAWVDTELGRRTISRLGTTRLKNLVQSLVAEASPEKFQARHRAARTGRYVAVRPAPDGMAWLTALLPAEQAIGCYAALRKHVNEVAAKPEPVTRGQGQIMADTLVERITGQTTAPAVPVEIQILVPAESLLNPDSPLPAQVPGYGPIPVETLARTTRTTPATYRRLFTRGGVIIGGEARRRRFTGQLAALIRARDDHRCREPYCDAPIRDIDHIHRHSDGGTTVLDNGRGLCRLHNQAREAPGWTATTINSTTVVTTTPTGRSYVSDLRTTTRRSVRAQGEPRLGGRRTPVDDRPRRTRKPATSRSAPRRRRARGRGRRGTSVGQACGAVDGPLGGR